MNSRTIAVPWRAAFGLGFLGLALAMALGLSGCAGLAVGEPEAPAAPEPFLQPLGAGWEGEAMIAQNHVGADGLAANLVNRLPLGARILCATFVDRDDFDSSSSFGRLVAAQYASRLAQAGFSVLEFRLRAEMGVRVGEGEFVLSRKTAQYMSENYDAHAVLVGSYTVDRRAVFVSAQVVRLDTGVVLASYDYAVPNTGAVARMLQDRAARVDFAGYLRSRGASGAPMAGMAPAGTGLGSLDLGLDTGSMLEFPQRVPGPQPLTGTDLAAPGQETESGGPIRLFPPTRLQ